jgi:hypothetical protein
MLHDLDPIIDDVARQMTTAPPDAGLAGRIATQIAASSATRRRAWARPLTLVPVAAACVLIVAAFVARQLTVEPPRKAAVARSASADAVPDRSVTIPTVQRQRGRVSTIAAPARERQNMRAAPSAVLPAIDVAPLEVNGLDIMPLVQAEDIHIDPIAIARIEIAPMP